jgi:hypothetical protein
MKARLALVAALVLPLGLSAMPTAVEYLPSRISLKQAVKLGDGSVLPAGAYDVQIHYKGFGNAAEFSFFLGGVFKGKTNAEARGFPAAAPGGVANPYTVKLQNADAKIGDVKGKDTSVDAKGTKIYEPAEQKGGNALPKVADHKSQSVGAPAAFNWESLGFRKGQKGTIMQASPGMLKLSFDSANSAAGFNAILPYAEKARK